MTIVDIDHYIKNRQELKQQLQNDLKREKQIIAYRMYKNILQKKYGSQEGYLSRVLF